MVERGRHPADADHRRRDPDRRPGGLRRRHARRRRRDPRGTRDAPRLPRHGPVGARDRRHDGRLVRDVPARAQPHLGRQRALHAGGRTVLRGAPRLAAPARARRAAHVARDGGRARRRGRDGGRPRLGLGPRSPAGDRDDARVRGQRGADAPPSRHLDGACGLPLAGARGRRRGAVLPSGHAGRRATCC